MPTAVATQNEDAVELLLKLVERSEETLFVKKKTDVDKDSDLDDDSLSLTSLYDLGPLASPWPIGPKRQINFSVRDGILKSKLEGVIENNPTLAKELILALLIRHPMPQNVERMFGTGKHFVYLNDCHCLLYTSPSPRDS